MSPEDSLGPSPYTRRRFLRTGSSVGLALAGRNLLGAGCALADQQVSRPQTATIRVDTERTLGTIDPNVFGGFVEHKGTCVYGGLYSEGSPVADADGDRKDVLDAIRGLHVTQVRWPGGNSVSDYHWQDGIGPKGARPMRYDLAWLQKESNRYGVDEFITTCRKLGTEPYICVNMGTGTMDEATSWLEYCNRPAGTSFSDLRKKYGHAEPYRVKYWGLGNEVYGPWQIGHKNAEDYAKQALEFAKVMKWMDPNIKLVASGSGDPAWDRPVLEMLGDHIDFISVHCYAICDDLKDYYEIMGSVSQMESLIRSSAATADATALKSRKRLVSIAVDEWNIIPVQDTGKTEKGSQTHPFHFNVRDALWVACGLNALLRNCRSVRMANHANLINDLSPIYTTPDGILFSTIYYPLQLYASRAGKVTLDVLTSEDTFETRSFGPQPYLDVLGTYDPDSRKLTLAVVNRCKEAAIVGTVDLCGLRAKAGGRVFTITGSTPETENTFSSPTQVVTRSADFHSEGSHFEHSFPEHSISWLEVNLV